ncbi:MAG: thioredoxin family protein, partial [Pedobacter sp.]|nr:thioredoxin family protein [Chitinophagaceae bacterium]
MKLIAALFIVASFSNLQWLHNYNEAVQLAQKNHKHILLNFSGSDWCGPCIRLRDEVFSTDNFKKLADANLVLLNADFPRNKKNQLPSAQQQINDALAEKYNPQGAFPYTVLLNENGKVIKA